MLLLDSHIFLWMLADDPRLSGEVRTRIVQAEPHLYLSAVSLWELRIKEARGQLELPEDPAQAAMAIGLTPIPITWAHALAAGALPPHHRDPFDRMLVAQAQLSRLTLVTHDARMRPYDVAVLWA